MTPAEWSAVGGLAALISTAVGWVVHGKISEHKTDPDPHPGRYICIGEYNARHDRLQEEVTDMRITVTEILTIVRRMDKNGNGKEPVR